MTQIITQDFTTDLHRHLAVLATKNDGEYELHTFVTDTAFVTAVTSALSTLDAGTGITRMVNPRDPEKLLFVVVIDQSSTRDAFGDLARAAAGIDELVLISAVEDLEEAVEGALLGAYVFDEYKEPKKSPLGRLIIPATDHDGAIVRAQVIAEATNRVRNLVNLAPNEIVPETLAQIAQEEATAAGCSVTIYREDELAEIGAAGLLHVGRGSANPPRLVRIEWAPENVEGETIALVGKGITFDTGGYSLKPATSMTEMKTDMAGAATVLQTLVAAARLNVQKKAVGWMCIAENMVSGTAGHPDDVITYRNGTSVEINNTDAEGRLVLADGLLMASEEKSEKIIDIATLTGAQMVALGERYTGIMGTEEYAKNVTDLANRVGEDAWHMPLPSHLRESLDSDVADMRNSGSRFGGMLVAGLFLKEFVDAPHWAHVDIAGPSFNRGKAYGIAPKGATGIMLRTLLAAVEE